MKKILVSLLVLASALSYAQTPDNIYSVTTCPAEDASTAMRISWAQDTTVSDSYVLLTEIKDRKWRKAIKVVPEQQEYCTVFDSIYSKAADGVNFYENAKFTKCGATLTGLKPDTEYKYAICVGPKVRKATRLSTEHKFKTAGAAEWSCCVISDYHSYPPLGKRLVAAMDMIETVKNFDPSIDLILHAGDITAWGGSYSFWKEMYKSKAFEDYMWAGVNGNHDNMSRLYQLTNNYFRYTNYYPTNGYAGEEGVCYHFRYGNTLIITLNNENMRKENELFAAQRWVKKIVTEAKASANPPTYIIVMEHYQWFFGGNGETSQYGRWKDLFDELGVDLAIAGNNHIYLRTGCIFDGKKTDGSYGTMYLQTTSSDNERGQGMKPEIKHNEDLIEYRFTEGNRTVSAIDMKVNDEQITITLLDRTGKVLDTAVVKAKANKITKPDVRGNYLRDSLDVMTERCAKTLKAAYMAEKLISINDSVPGWEGFPVGLYEYHTGIDININDRKRALVYLLNPEPKQLAKWIINAVYDATGDVKYADLEKVRKHILYQSGGQFPVAGVVYEAMYKAGDYVPYIFKDGVTVYLADEETWKSKDKNPNEEQLNFYLSMTYDDLNPNTGTYARICSTTREMYYKAGGKDEVGKSEAGKKDRAWLSTVKKLYQQAWKSDKNFLIYAWALENLR